MITEEEIHYSVSDLVHAHEECFWVRNKKTNEYEKVPGRKGMYIINYTAEFTTDQLKKILQKAIKLLQQKMEELKKLEKEVKEE